ncbi:MAG: apolipoprotein N-acyltransferase [Candidatus Omnitrophica bacterium]|nr:apolipoprotein N-acyltransferase [Candidatus Omnitrophota bacterium]
MKKYDLYFALCVLFSSVFFSLSFPSFINKEGFWFLAYIFAIPFFYVLDHARPLQKFMWTVLCAVISYSMILYWLFPLSFKGAIVFVLFMSLQLVIFMWIYNKIKNNILIFIYVPSAWVVSEYIRSFLFKGFCWGVGYSQSFNTYTIQCADIFGSYGLSFLIIMINFLLYRMIKEKELNKIFAVIVILALIFGYGYIKQKDIQKTISEKDIFVSIVQGNISQKEKWDEAFEEKIKKTYKDLSLEVDDRTEILIWPETSLPCDYDDQNIGFLIDIMGKKDTQMIFGVAVNENNKFYNRAVWMDKDGKIIGEYDKIKTIPFFEYAPFNKKALYFLGDINEDPVWFSSGEKIGLFEHQDKRIGILICFEDFFEELTRQLVVNKANLLVNITNDALFENSSEAYLHLQASVFRAVENRINIVRSANTGFSCIISDKGVIINKIHKNNRSLMVSGQLTGFVHLNNKSTIYNKIGYVFPFFCFLIIIIGGTMNGIKKIIGSLISKRTMVLLLLLSFFFSAESFPVADKRRMQGQPGAQAQKPQPKKRQYVNIEGVQSLPEKKDLSNEKKQKVSNPVIEPQTLTAANSTRSGSSSALTEASITSEIINTFNNNSTQWLNINYPSLKEDILKYYISEYANNGIVIKNPPALYVVMIDNLIQQNPSVANMPLYSILQTVSIIEYDFNNGQDKDMLAKKVLGESAWKDNRERLEKQGKI